MKLRELDDESQEKIYFTLKSIFRYHQLKTLNAPQILFDAEDKILKSRMDSLNSEEICCMIEAWPEFYAEYSKEDALIQAKLDEDFKQYLLSQN